MKRESQTVKLKHIFRQHRLRFLMSFLTEKRVDQSVKKVFEQLIKENFFSQVNRDKDPIMFCPSNETLAQLTEKTKLLAQKYTRRPTDQSNATSSKPVARQQVATFKSYIGEAESVSGAETVDFTDVSQSPLQCLNLSSLNRLIKTRCSFITSSSYSCSTFPRRKKPKKATAKWFIKVSL